MNFLDRIAKPIAAEIMELTADQRRSFKFPDDVNGDTYDRATSAARLVLKAIAETREIEEADILAEAAKLREATTAKALAAGVVFPEPIER